MTPSRLGRFDRRRLVASCVLGGAAIVTAGQLVSAGTKTSQPAALAMQDDSSDVPMFRGNAARTGVTLGPGPGPGPDASNGVEVIWQFPAENNTGAFFISPAIVDSVVYVASRDGSLYALNAEDGLERWQFTIGGAVGYPEVVSDVVYVGSRDINENLSSYYAVNADDGTERWRFPTGSPNNWRPVVVGEVAYVVGHPNLFALDAGRGTERWRFTAEQGIGTLPVVVDEVVFVEADGTYLFALNAEDGTERWRFPTGGRVFLVDVIDGVVYLGSEDGYIYAVSAVEGTERWRFPTGGEISTVGVVVVDGVVYVRTEEGYIYAVNAKDGTERWRFTERYVAYPFPVDGVVYVGGGVVGPDANVYALNVENGAELWQLAISDAVQVNILWVVDGMVYGSNGVGELYAIGARVPRLSVGGTARVRETISLRGGPALTAVERGELTPDTVVTITGESEMTGDLVWWPVVVNETGEQGWVEASALEPLSSGPQPTATP